MKRLLLTILLFLFVFYPPTAFGSLSDGLVMHLLLDETSGTTAYDTTSNHYNGTLYNSTGWGTGKINGGSVFNLGDYIILPNATCLQAPLTRTFWFKTYQLNNPMLFSSDRWTGLSMWLSGANNNIQFHMRNYSPDLLSTTAIQINRWYHVAVTYDNTYAKLYVNGTLEASIARSGTIGYKNGCALAEHVLGAYITLPSIGANLNGVMDDVRIYNRALSDEEILSMYTPARPTTTSLSGSYQKTQTITLVNSDPDDSIYYTLDGSVPTLLSNLYSSPIDISSTKIVKARTIKGGFVSDVLEQTIIIDPTAPPQTFSVTDPSNTTKTYEKRFERINSPNLKIEGHTDFPTFCFSKAVDNTNGTGISKYAVFVDNHEYIAEIPYIQPSKTEYGARTVGELDIIKERDDAVIRYSNYLQIEKDQQICVYGKGDKKRLYPGAHHWYVRVWDNVGNITDTERGHFFVRINMAVYQDSSNSFAGWGDFYQTTRIWFPLHILQIGNKNNIKDLSTNTPHFINASKDIYHISTITPTFYGIANSNSEIILEIYNTTKLSDGSVIATERVTSSQTTVNQESRWGINLSHGNNLQKKTLYLATITAKQKTNVAVIKDIPIYID